MAYGTPSDPVAGTVITVAYAVANLLDPIRWLRLLTGNADPPGSNYVVVSTSTTGTSWQKVPADALATGVAVANLGYTPVNKAGDAMAGELTMGATLGVTLGGTGTPSRIFDIGGTGLTIRVNNNLARFYNADFSVIMLGLSATVAAFAGAVQAVTAAFSGAVTVGGNLGVTGSASAASLAAASAAISGSASVGANFGVVGSETVGGDLTVTGTTGTAAINASGAVTSAAIVKGTRLEVTVNDGIATPIIIPAGQANVTVPNLRAASAATATNATNAADAANSALLNGHAEAALVVATAGNANALGGVGPAGYGIPNSVAAADSSGALSLTSTMQAVPGCSINAPSTGTYLVLGTAFGFAQVAGGDVTAQIAVAGSLVGTAQKINQAQFGSVPDVSAFGGGTVMYVGAITSGQAVSLRAKSAVTSTSTIDNGQISLVRIF